MRRGSISIFLALLVPLLLALLLTAVESARYSGVQLRARDAGNAAVDSVMAGYNRELLEEYGLLFYDGSFNKGLISHEEIEAEFAEWLDRNLSRNLGSGGTLFPVRAEQVLLTDTVSATDYSGEIFIRSVLEYAKYDEVGSLIDTVKEQLALLGEGDAVKSEYANERDELEQTDWGAKPEANRAVVRYAAEGGAPEDGEPEPDDPFDEERFENDLSQSAVGKADQVKASGWLALVVPGHETVSTAKADKSEFPSVQARDSRVPEHEDGFGDVAVEKILFNEYLLHYFPTFLDHADGDGLKYGIEYILYGNESDSENLKTVLNRIMWIREGMNLLYLATSSHQFEAHVAAEVLMGWTLNPIIVELTAAALLAAWAYGESLLDVRALLSGKKIDLIKNDSTWTLALENLDGAMDGGDFMAKESAVGLSYGAYLRLLLYLSDTNDCAYRAMDLIQVRMRTYNPRFLMASQLYAAEFQAEFYAKEMFVALPIVRNTIGVGTLYRWKDHFSEVY